MNLTAPITSIHAANVPADALGACDRHDQDRHDLHRHLDARAEELWAETNNWRAAVEDIVDAVLLRVSAIELSKVRSTWT